MMKTNIRLHVGRGTLNRLTAAVDCGDSIQFGPRRVDHFGE